VAQLIAALITVHGLLSFLSDMYGLFDPFDDMVLLLCHQLVSSDGDRQRAIAFYQMDQRGHTHLKGRTMDNFKFLDNNFGCV